MKQTDPHSRFHWPRDGVAVRVPPRRLAGSAPSCELIPFAGRRAEPSRRVSWDALAAALPRGTRVVLLVAAEDVSFTAADVPALSGLRLREALPNLVEDRTVGEIGSLHVALGESATTGRGRTLAMVDRAWIAIIQVHVARAGHRVAATVPDSLAVPFVVDQWSLACVAIGAGGDGVRCWLRTGSQQAMPLPDDAASAVAVATALARQGPSPTRLACHAAPPVASTAASLGAALASALEVPLADNVGDPFAAWLAGDGPDGGYGPALSLLAFDGGNGVSRWSKWRLAAVLAVIIVAVQVIGMQWQWAGLRREANALRQESTGILVTTFPDTRVVLDAPLQMSRGLATLRASSGRSDPGDFTMMMAASARIFAALPSNALRGADFESHALKLRFAPGMAVAADERERFVAEAAQEGYALAFDATTNAVGESSASLRTRRAS